MCITVPTTGTSANAGIQTDNSLNGVHDANTLEFIDSFDFSVLMTMNKQNGLDINMDTVIRPSNTTDQLFIANDSTDHTLFIVKNNRKVDVDGNVTAHDTTVNDLTTYNAHVNAALNIDNGLNVRRLNHGLGRRE